MKAILAADLGAGSLRAAAVDEHGRVLASARRISDARPQQGAAHEADPAEWVAALLDAFAEVLAAITVSVEAIAITAMTRGQVFLDGSGAVVRPAILWRDTRAAKSAGALARRAGLAAGVNPAVGLNAFHPLSRLAFLEATEPEAFARVRHAVEPKDFLNFRLTGKLATDTVVAARTTAILAHRNRVMDAFAQRLPRAVKAPWTVLGSMTDGTIPSLRGVPVVVSSMDSWAAAIGCGAAVPGVAYDICGTSEAAGLIVEAPATAHGLVDLPWAPGAHQLGGPTQAGGDALAFAHGFVAAGEPFEDSVARAGEVIPSATTPIFLPYLAGERAPVWRTDVAGALFGLRRETRPDEALFAAMEGVGLAVGDIVMRAQEAAGETAGECFVCGGGARSDAWCQIKADALALDVVRPRQVEGGLLGVAAAAQVAIGAADNLGRAARQMNPAETRFTPRPELASVFQRRREAWHRLKAFALQDAGWG